MTTPDVTQTHNPRELLSALPLLTGSAPRNSIVLIPLVGQRAVGALRADIPAREQADALATTLLGHTCRVEGMTGAALVVCTDDQAEHAAQHAEPIIQRADQCGTDLVAALYIASDGWGQVHSSDCPRDLSEIDHDRSDVPNIPYSAELPQLTTERVEGIANALLDYNESEDLTANDFAIFDRVAQTSHPEDLDDTDAGALLAMLSAPRNRVVALIQWASDATTGNMAYCAEKNQDEASCALMADILAGDAPRPSSTRLKNALGTVKHVAAAAPTSHAPGALAAAAWLSWALGLSSHAETLARQANAGDPAQSLAKTILALTGAGRLPSWAFRP